MTDDPVSTVAHEKKQPVPIPGPETLCVHCGLPVGFHPVLKDDLAFCCTGCEFVFDALGSGGFRETFYHLSKSQGFSPPPQKNRITLNELELAALDVPGFLDRFAERQSDGSFSADLFLDGIHCSACVWLIEQLPEQKPEVLQARVDMARYRLSLQWYPDRLPLSDIARWLAQFGYSISPTRQQIAEKQAKSEKRLLIKMGVAWALAGNIMLLAIAFYGGLDVGVSSSLTTAGRWLSLLLAIPAVTYGGSEFFRKAYGSVRLAIQRRSPLGLHIDVPIALGITIGFIHSVWATLTMQSDIWFDSITVLIAALLTARWLHVRSTRVARNASEQLLELVPTMVRRLIPGSTPRQNEMVSVEDVKTGDVIAVYGGEVFPVDGRVKVGSSAVNRAVLTGESRPVRIAIGDRVHAGSTNLTEPVDIVVDAAGEATRLGKLLRWIETGGESRAPIVLLADRLSGIFVIVVLLLSIVTAAWWITIDPARWMDNVVALLVITCPCALGMATPLAMAIAAGRAARRGVYLKTSEAIQRLANVSTVVLDKTGTLTEGNLKLISWSGSRNAKEYAGLLETKSRHPIAAAFVEAVEEVPALLRDPGYRLTDVKTYPKGLTGIVNGHQIKVGQPSWVVPDYESRFPALKAEIERAGSQGQTPVAVSVDGVFDGLACFGDHIRSDAAETVSFLSRGDRAVVLLSGDHPETAGSVGRALGLDAGDSLGLMSPEDKRSFVQKRQSDGQMVAMIGDGFNDAGALRAADVGIAVKGGSTASMLAADVFITTPGLEPVRMLFESAPRVMKVIKVNLTISLVYNVLGAMAAMAGLITPLAAAIAMPVSSLIVVGLSITQRTFISRKRV